MTIAARIAQVRKEQNLSQEAFGSALGVSRQSISKWESGVSLPETEKLVAICRIYGVHIEWLLCMDGAPSEPEYIAPPSLEPLPVSETAHTEDDRSRKCRKSSHRIWLGALCGVLAMAVLTGALLLTGLFRFGTQSLEGPGFDSPEAAVQGYLDALKKGDAETMLSTFAQETYVDHFDFSALVTRIHSYTFNLMQRLPADGGFAKTLDLAQRRGELAQQLYWQYLTLTQPNSEIFSGESIFFDTDEEIGRFVSELSDPAYLETLKTLELISFADPASITASYQTEANLATIQKQTVCYGADEIQPMACNVTLGGTSYIFCFDTVRYGSKWYNLNTNGNLSVLLNISAFNSGVLPEE